MKVVHWNISKRSQPMYGLKRYEDELFKNIKRLDEDLEIERMQRPDSKILGIMFASWFFTYKCKNADIVHATVLTTAPAIYFNLRKPTKFVATIFDLASLRYRYKCLSPRAYIPLRIQYSLGYKALQKADKVIADSEFAKKELMRFVDIDESKIKVIYLGVDHSRYKPMDKTKCKERFGLNLDERHILVFTGILKGMDLAKAVFDDLKSKRADIKMIKIGYSEILSGDGIINVGYIDEAEMPCLFNAADVYLHTAEYATFALPALEAMSCGVPIVVSNKPGLPEVLGSYDGLVDLDSGDCIKNFSDKILSRLDRGVDYEAIKQSRNFPWRKTAEETLRLYEEVYKE